MVDRAPGARARCGKSAKVGCGWAALTWLPPVAGCRCDVGGALGQGCDPRTGACRCRPNTQGLTCAEWVPHPGGWRAGGRRGSSSGRGPGGLPLTAPVVARPARDHYLPDLHDLRLELEEAATPEGRTARFGFNPLEFESFGWRGYAQMSPIQVGGELPGPGLSVESPLRPAAQVGGGGGDRDQAGNGQGGATPTLRALVPSSPGSW